MRCSTIYPLVSQIFLSKFPLIDALGLMFFLIFFPWLISEQNFTCDYIGLCGCYWFCCCHCYSARRHELVRGSMKQCKMYQIQPTQTRCFSTAKTWHHTYVHSPTALGCHVHCHIAELRMINCDGVLSKTPVNVFHAYYYQVVQILKQSKLFTFYIQPLVQPWQKMQLRFTRVTGIYFHGWIQCWRECFWMKAMCWFWFLNANFSHARLKLGISKLHSRVGRCYKMLLWVLGNPLQLTSWWVVLLKILLGQFGVKECLLYPFEFWIVSFVYEVMAEQIQTLEEWFARESTPETQFVGFQSCLLWFGVWICMFLSCRLHQLELNLNT